MPTAYFRNNADRRIADGTYTYTFNPTGDVTGAEVTEVRYNFKLDYNNGSAVDLDEIQIWLQAPDGDRDRIYYNFPNANIWANDNDDHNDSDDANDWDIDFDAVHPTSRTNDLSGAKVTGTWRLIIENDTGRTLDLDGLEVFVGYNRPEDYTITDLEIVGGQEVGQPVQIRATIENIGQLYKLERVEIEYLVNGQVIGTSALLAGLAPGAENVETELHTFNLEGANTVTARIVGAPDTITSNNSLTRTFIFEHNDPDLAVTDIRVTGNGEAGSTHFIAVDVTNVGNATHTGDILLEYYVDGDMIGTQTIGGAGVNIMLPGTENTETEAHFMSDAGPVDIEVRIANPGSDDHSSANDSLTTTISFDAPDEAPDLAITDLRVIGGWDVGEEVNLRAHIENNGTQSWNILAGLPYVEYFVRYEGESSWETVGGDAMTGGSVEGFSEWVSTDFTLEHDGPFEVRVDVRGRDYESNTANNTWRESAGYSRADAPQKTIENSASDVKLAAFLARTVYGIDDIPEDWRDDGTINGLNDDYTGYLDSVGFKVLTDRDFGDLFRPVDEKSRFYGSINNEGQYEGGLFAGDQGLAFSNSDLWQAQGLVAEGLDADGTKTLTLTFRGTDKVDLLESLAGQAWTGDGLYDYYESMRPLIEAALAYANDSANGIEKVLVTGHSLGGATADAFALVDAHRLKDSIDLTVVSLASPGVDINFLEDTYVFKGMEGQFDRTDLYDAFSINAEPFYIGVSHRIDAVTYPFLNPLNPLEKVPNQPLLTNLNMDDKLTAILTPNIDNDDLPGYNFGAGHNVGLYWANLSQIMSNPLKVLHNGHRIIAGLSDYSQIEDLTGETFGVFIEYDAYGTNGNPDDDEGELALTGDDGRDFILGFSGNDVLYGEEGADLLSGGTGDDLIHGGAADDVIHGGDGRDTARYRGSFFDYEVQSEGEGAFAVTSDRAQDAGVDALSEIEVLWFSDGMFTEGSFALDLVRDTADAHDWANFSETYDIDQIRTSREVNYDDGRDEAIAYANGQRATRTLSDSYDAYAWDQWDETYDADGTRVERVITYDDGRVSRTLYEDGTLASTRTTDTASAYRWSTIDLVYQADGHLQRTQVFDDGRLQEASFINGVPVLQTTTDVEDAYNWETRIEAYDGDGIRVERSISYDNGRLSQTTFEDGALFSTRTTDTANVYGWSQIDLLYGADGHLLRTQTYDDGRVEVASFVDRVPVSKTTTDVGDVFDWESRTEAFDDRGNRTERVITYDDGRVAQSTYENRNLVSTQTTDTADVFIWSTIGLTFDATGLVDRTQTYDDGLLEETSFVDGVRSVRTMTDVEDVFEWANYRDTFDGNGDQIDRVFTYDDGSTEAFLY